MKTKVQLESEVDLIKQQLEQNNIQMQKILELLGNVQPKNNVDNQLVSVKETSFDLKDSKSVKGEFFDDEGDIEIKADAYIKVMSLITDPLNLSTEPRGGRIFRFNSFGEVKRILYSDLLRIIENNKSFFEKFYFIILDSRFLRKHSMEELYQKALTKERIELLFDPHANQSDAVNIFKSATEPQRESIVNLLLDRMLVHAIEPDYNLLERLSKVIGYDIAEKFKNIQEVNANLTNNGK